MKNYKQALLHLGATGYLDLVHAEIGDLAIQHLGPDSYSLTYFDEGNPTIERKLDYHRTASVVKGWYEQLERLQGRYQATSSKATGTDMQVLPT